jgi:glutathione peroxidase
MSALGDFTATSLEGEPLPLKAFAGKAVLVVNVASQCGLTPQYAGLQKLHHEFGGKGLVVLGLPCNQFGAQEPGTEAQIQQFCSTTYDVSFPMSAKLEVNGSGRHPVYSLLTAAEPGDIQWNFEKFLIGRDGRVLKRYPPTTTPQDSGLMQDIADAL